MTARVVAVSARSGHHFSKPTRTQITLLKGLGVEGDVHAGLTVQDSYNKRKTPGAPNVRQVHLMPVELLDELAVKGFTVGPGDIGDNVATSGLDLMALPEGARLTLGAAVIELTGLRTPCSQLNKFAPGLLNACLEKVDGQVILKCGVMGVVLEGGIVRPDDGVEVDLPDEPWRPLPPL